MYIYIYTYALCIQYNIIQHNRILYYIMVHYIILYIYIYTHVYDLLSSLLLSRPSGSRGQAAAVHEVGVLQGGVPLYRGLGVVLGL